jgi:hypothetical protein
MLELRELLDYAFEGRAPIGFVDRLVSARHLWDEEFKRRLEEIAYEFRPDLAEWEISMDADGALVERRIAPALDRLPHRIGDHRPEGSG